MGVKLAGVIRSATYEEVRAVQQAVLRPDGPLPGDIPMPSDWVHVAAVREGAVVGALILGVLNNGLNLLGVSAYWQQIIKGFIIVTAVVIDMRKNAKKK